MSKIWLFILGSILLVFLFVIYISGKVTSTSAGISESSAQSKLLDDGRQLVEIVAKGGYNPRVITAKAGIETVLKVESRQTFDCSSSLVIPSLRLRKNLPPTGFTEIILPAQSAGSQINGTCSMGMYGFVIKFV